MCEAKTHIFTVESILIIYINTFFNIAELQQAPVMYFRVILITFFFENMWIYW